MLTVVPGDGSGHEGGKDGPPPPTDEIVREGARRMPAEALQAEVDAYIAAHAAERDENGHRLVVRNGSHQSREVLTSAGTIGVTAPRVNDKRTDPVSGDRQPDEIEQRLTPPAPPRGKRSSRRAITPLVMTSSGLAGSMTPSPTCTSSTTSERARFESPPPTWVSSPTPARTYPALVAEIRRLRAGTQGGTRLSCGPSVRAAARPTCRGLPRTSTSSSPQVCSGQGSEPGESGDNGSALEQPGVVDESWVLAET
jgi:Transposase, Mutator family